MAALLEVTDLRAGYGPIEVLKGINLTVGAGECVALQARLFDALWTTLAPGGVFVYATCSVLRDENDRPPLEYELEKVERGFFAPDLLLDYLRYFVLFEQGDGRLTKKIAAYHQFHAVREAVRATITASTQPVASAFANG